MPTTNNNPKQKPISKKWVYGSLAVIALILGLYLDNAAVASEPYPVVDQAEIDNENDDVEIDADDNSKSDDIDIDKDDLSESDDIIEEEED